jgi:hypothetical protein
MDFIFYFEMVPNTINWCLGKREKDTMKTQKRDQERGRKNIWEWKNKKNKEIEKILIKELSSKKIRKKKHIHTLSLTMKKKNPSSQTFSPIPECGNPHQ